MKKKHYAFAEHETIQAMVHSLFRFQTLEQAQLITNKFAEEFSLAPKFSDPLDKKSFVLWVRGLDVSEEQRKQGYLGNFGRITMHSIPSGKWTLTLARMDIALRHHPLKKSVPKPHPNMGHPVIRAASRKKTWPSMQAAAEQLMKLHEEFPEISVPGLNKLKIMTYVRAEKGQSPVQRLELQVVKRDEGVYIIEIKQNLRKHFPALPVQQPHENEVNIPAATVTPELPADQPGYYAKLVSKRRKKKK